MATPKQKAAPKPKSPAQIAKEQRERQAKAREVQQLRDYYKKNGHVPTLLSNTSKSRFGEADTKRVSELGALVAKGKITREEAERRIKQGAGVANEDVRRAGLDVSAELDPKINSATRRRQTAKELLERQRARVQGRIKDETLRTEMGIGTDTAKTQASAAAVAKVYEQLQQRMMQMNQQNQQQYQSAIQQTQQGTQSLQQGIQDIYNKANAATQQQVSGMGGGVTEGQIGGQSSSAWLQSLAGIQGQSQLGQVNAAALGDAGIGRAQVAYEGANSASQQTDMLAQMLQRAAAARTGLTERTRDLNDDLSETEDVYYEEDAELSGSIADLEESRFAKLYEGKKGLEAARAQAQAEAEDREFERQLAQAKLSIDQGELDVKRQTVAQRAQEAADRLGIDRQRLDILSRQTDAKLAAEQRKYTPGTLEYEEIQAAIDLKRADAASKVANAKTNQQKAADDAAYKQGRLDIDAQKASQASASKPQNFGKGTGGAITYINQGVRPEFRPNANRVLGYINKNYSDNYARGMVAVEKIIKKYSYPPDVASAIRRMAGIYYGKGT